MGGSGMGSVRVVRASFDDGLGRDKTASDARMTGVRYRENSGTGYDASPSGRKTSTFWWTIEGTKENG